ncbi:MAG: carbohydrate binding domain-containing protein [Kiritimatiellae bacterium]|nr:carbohydrate binding domain-containing protein [Kiritimatiellia bacterium]
MNVSANLISNSGFETSWENWSAWGNYMYSDTAGSYMDNAGNPGGIQAGALQNTGSEWSGFYQDGSSVTVGETYTASAYATVDAATSYGFAAVKLEFYNGGTLLTGVTNAFSALSSGTWTYSEVSGVAPVGTTAARINIFVDNITSAGNLYVDGASLTAVPEPVSAALLGLGIVAIYAARRKVRK